LLTKHHLLKLFYLYPSRYIFAGTIPKPVSALSPVNKKGHYQLLYRSSNSSALCIIIVTSYRKRCKTFKIYFNAGFTCLYWSV